MIRLQDKSSSGGAYARDKNTSAGLCAKMPGGRICGTLRYIHTSLIILIFPIFLVFTSSLPPTHTHPHPPHTTHTHPHPPIPPTLPTPPTLTHTHPYHPHSPTLTHPPTLTHTPHTHPHSPTSDVSSQTAHCTLQLLHPHHQWELTWRW